MTTDSNEVRRILVLADDRAWLFPLGQQEHGHGPVLRPALREETLIEGNLSGVVAGLLSESASIHLAQLTREHVALALALASLSAGDIHDPGDPGDPAILAIAARICADWTARDLDSPSAKAAQEAEAAFEAQRDHSTSASPGRIDTDSPREVIERIHDEPVRRMNLEATAARDRYATLETELGRQASAKAYTVAASVVAQALAELGRLARHPDPPPDVDAPRDDRPRLYRVCGACGKDARVCGDCGKDTEIV